MDRFFSTLAIFAMFLFAIWICILQTLEARGSLGTSVTTGLIMVQIVIGIGMLAGTAALIRKRFRSQGRSPVRGRAGFAQPLRRLFLTVWS